MHIKSASSKSSRDSLHEALSNFVKITHIINRAAKEGGLQVWQQIHRRAEPSSPCERLGRCWCWPLPHIHTYIYTYVYIYSCMYIYICSYIRIYTYYRLSYAMKGPGPSWGLRTKLPYVVLENRTPSEEAALVKQVQNSHPIPMNSSK